MTEVVTRRVLLKGLAATGGAVVVGWSPLSKTWVTAAAAHSADHGHDTSGMQAVPPLDGTLESGPAVLADFSGDFGHMIQRLPTAVLRPGSVDDVAKMVRYARRNRLKIAMNGQSGTPDKRESHSNYGQAEVQGGIVVDVKTLATIHSIDATSADVDAGVSWADLVTAAAAVGKTPPVLTDFLHLSIGGTLSVGGVGGTVQKFGCQVDNVEELLVVTGDGDIVRCSRYQEPWLFNAVLAGAGQCALIVRAKVKLVPAQTNALIFNLFYNDLPTFVADQVKVMNDGRFSHQEGQIVRKPDDSGWRYMIELASYYTPPAVPDQTALLAGLSDDRPSARIVDLPYPIWAFRLDPVVAQLKAAGFWEQPKPWLNLFVPASQVVRYIGDVVAQLTPPDLGAGLALLYPVKQAPMTRPLFEVTRSREPVAFMLNLLRFPFPGFPGIPGMLTQNRSFYDEAVQLGGKRYIIGAVPNMSVSDWRAHFGPQWFFLNWAKETYDPGNVLTPGQGMFP